MQRIRLNQHPLKIQLAQELSEYRPLVVLAGVIAGLADGHAQGCRVQRHLGNECGATAASGGLDRTPQSLAITDQLIVISCAT